MTKFPDAYKKHILEHSEDILEVADALRIKRPDLTLIEACAIVSTAHTDCTLAVLMNSVKFTVSDPVRKIK
jgi:hypothetical protein